MKNKRRGSLALTILFLALTLTSAPVHAAVPQTINYQGYLTDAANNPVDGTVSMTFRIYNVLADGTALWTETQETVQVSNGIYNIVLGSVNPVDLSFNEQYYLGIEIGTDGEMSPRQQLTAVPYAFRALRADTVADNSITASKLGENCQVGQFLVKTYTGWQCASIATTQNGAGACTALGCSYFCNPLYGNCDGNWSNGCEMDLTVSPSDCGSCGNMCPTAQYAASACISGSCGPLICSSPIYRDCDNNMQNGCEVDTDTDANNCSACGASCAAVNSTEACIGGVCAIGSCNNGYADCNGQYNDGCEVNLNTDMNNCGACGVSCALPGVSIGVMKKGSIIVNGVTMTVPPAAVITVDDVAGKTEADLKDGMVVKVKGQFKSDGLTGVAEQIEAEDEIQGNVEAKGAGSLTVVGQNIIVGPNTIFPSGQSFAAIVAADMVEVHGLRDNNAAANGDIHATRIEVGKITAAAGGLQRLVGPTGPVNGFPTFYQDENGLQLDLCVDLANCLNAPPDPANPFSVQIGFDAEAFYYELNAIMGTPTVNQILYIAALEAEFTTVDNPATPWDETGAAVDGQQALMAKLRINIDAPVAGTYTVTHPYGVSVFAVATPGVRAIRSTIDIGGLAPLDFTTALSATHAFPFVTAVAPAPQPGTIGSPFALQTITGGPNGNILRVEAPVGANMDGLGNNVVETNVFGLQGRIFAAPVEIKGVVENLNVLGGTFTIGAKTVNIATAIVEPVGGTITAGARVEIEGVVDSVTGVLNAQKVEIEAAEDAAFVPVEGQAFHVEGYIAGFAVHPGDFKAGPTSVRTSATTIFVGGTATDLANGKAVRAKGMKSGGVLDAREIAFLTAL